MGGPEPPHSLIHPRTHHATRGLGTGIRAEGGAHGTSPGSSGPRCSPSPSPSERARRPLRCGARSAPQPQPPAGARQARPQAAARPIPGGRSAGLRGARSLGAVGPLSARDSEPQPSLSASRPSPLAPSPGPEARPGRGAHSLEVQWPLLPPRRSLFIFAERRGRLGGGAREGRGVGEAPLKPRPFSLLS